MSVFMAHAMPGIFSILFGTWWTFAAWSNYIRSTKNKRRYVCRCSYPMSCLTRKFSVEGIVKIIGSCVCIAREYSETVGYYPSLHGESVQHQFMYAFYVLNGVVDVMYNAGFPFPQHTDYVTLLLAVISEGLLLHFNLLGKLYLDAMVHQLLVYTVAALVACLVAEMCRPESVLASLGRAYFCLLHGTWLWQIAFMLDNPLAYGCKPWDVNIHVNLMLTASAFSGHLMVLLVYVGALGALAWAVNRMCGRFCHDVVSVGEEEEDNFSEALINAACEVDRKGSALSGI